MDKNELLKIVYSQEKEFVSEVGQREFDCLVSCIEYGSITDKNIEDYGINLPK